MINGECRAPCLQCLQLASIPCTSLLFIHHALKIASVGMLPAQGLLLFSELGMLSDVGATISPGPMWFKLFGSVGIGVVILITLNAIFQGLSPNLSNNVAFIEEEWEQALAKLSKPVQSNALSKIFSSFAPLCSFVSVSFCFSLRMLCSPNPAFMASFGD
ncbi:hypothetical protein MRB53_014080 [Persea americana]|uniref:Uncharacterized protein n=1 Tax=Persea americana TaxID=3435 RepID=A0ACC2KAC0_PERAE|nr:hypothetical protein MRB53_014080 [Persea americana]